MGFSAEQGCGAGWVKPLARHLLVLLALLARAHPMALSCCGPFRNSRSRRSRRQARRPSPCRGNFQQALEQTHEQAQTMQARASLGQVV